jgi:hypothetical protein
MINIEVNGVRQEVITKDMLSTEILTEARSMFSLWFQEYLNNYGLNEREVAELLVELMKEKHPERFI